MAISVAKHRNFAQSFTPHTWAVGRFLDVVWVDLGVTFATVRLYTYVLSTYNDMDTWISYIAVIRLSLVTSADKPTGELRKPII